MTFPKLVTLNKRRVRMKSLAIKGICDY